jgi:hypothetical protein
MKEFYKIANKVLRIKRNHPVVSRVKRENEGQDPEVFEDRRMVDQTIDNYFVEVYKRPDHMQAHLEQEVDENVDMADEMINTTASSVKPQTGNFAVQF